MLEPSDLYGVLPSKSLLLSLVATENSYLRMCRTASFLSSLRQQLLSSKPVNGGMWVWLKIKQEGLRRFWSMCPLTRVPFWYRFFEPQPCYFASAPASKAFNFQFLFGSSASILLQQWMSPHVTVSCNCVCIACNQALVCVWARRLCISVCVCVCVECSAVHAACSAICDAFFGLGQNPVPW